MMAGEPRIIRPSIVAFEDNTARNVLQLRAPYAGSVILYEFSEREIIVAGLTFLQHMLRRHDARPPKHWPELGSNQ
ncbi:hypothetical protein BH10PSE7_BH10PSE7_15230 [soil metagenome]